MSKTYKVVSTGAYYSYKVFDEDKNEVVPEQGEQRFSAPTAPDVEKYLRNTVSGEDKIEVNSINNINPEDNTNVKLVVPEDTTDRYNGMTPVTESVTAKQDAEKADAIAEQKAASEDKLPENEKKDKLPQETVDAIQDNQFPPKPATDSDSQ